MNETKEIIVEVPLALQQLIRANNELLKNYQNVLVKQIEIANEQMMQILRLDSAAGWTIDTDRMVYTRPSTNEQSQPID